MGELYAVDEGGATMTELTDLQAWTALKLAADCSLTLAEACKIANVRVVDLLHYMESTGLKREAMRRLSPTAQERLSKITQAAMDVAFEESPIEALVVLQESAVECTISTL
jgi:TRAP-type mannitol/chloroaromatic compound transport system substrate-binding protein